MPSSFKSFTASFTSITPSPYGPSAVPAASSSTVCGMNLPGISCATIGLTAATAMMMVRETSSCVIPSSLVSHCDRRLKNVISAICGRFLRGNRPRGHDSYPLGLDLLKEPATHNANRFLVKGESATYSTFHDIKGVGRVCEAANPRFSSAARTARPPNAI